MIFLSAIAGIALRYLSELVGLSGVIAIGLGASSLGLILFIMASAIGAKHPQLCSFLVQAMAIGVLGIGSLIVLLGLEVTSRILAFRGGTPSSSKEALIMLIFAVVGILVERLSTLADLLSPSGISRMTLHLLYDARFPQRIEDESAEYRDAYQALFNEKISNEEGQISGWGYSATSRRLMLIARAVQRQDG